MTTTTEPTPAETDEHGDDEIASDGYQEAELVGDDESPRPTPPAEIMRATAHVGPAIEGLAVIPEHTEMNALAAMANTLAYADAVPKALRRKPNDVFLVLLTARDTGVALTTAMREFHVIEGTVTLSPKVKLAMVRASGHGKMWPKGDNDANGATWYAERADQPEHTVESTFTWEDSQLAGLTDSRCEPKKHWKPQSGSQSCMCKDNWKRYPQRMVSWRAAGYLLDDVFPEVATGLYSPDEIGAITNADGEPIEVSAVEPLQGMKGKPGTGPGAPEQATDGDKAAIQERIDALPETARKAYGAWWLEQELPKVAELNVRQIVKAMRRLDWQEQQVAASKPEEPAQEPQDGPSGDAAPTPAESPSAPEAPALESEVRLEAEEPIDLVQFAIEVARRTSGDALREDFAHEGMSPPKGSDDMVRRTWCEWMLCQLIGGATATLSVALFGINVVDQDDVAEAFAAARG